MTALVARLNRERKGERI